MGSPVKHPEMEAFDNESQVSGAISTLSENVDKLMQIEPNLMKNESGQFIRKQDSTIERIKTKKFLVFLLISLLLLIALILVSCFRYHQVVLVLIVGLIVSQCAGALWYSAYSSYKQSQSNSSDTEEDSDISNG